jgi:hypothetical protein
VLERRDLQEWIIENPSLLNEDLLVVTSEYDGFERTRDRLDVLALDRAGKLAVIELKRDKADRTTDLQVIKYASYCATLTPREVQELYREFRSDRYDESLRPEDVGGKFADFLNEAADEEVPLTEDGWAEFDLDDKPRILLAAGSFGIEITSPVLWLTEEYGMNVACVRIEAYEHRDRILLYSQQLTPVPETEEYMTRRRQKDRNREPPARRQRAIDVLLERGELTENRVVYFNDRQLPEGASFEEREEEFWRAEITGKTGQSDDVWWEQNDETYSFTSLTKRLLNDLVDRDSNRSLNGYKYWCREEGGKSLSAIRRDTD